MKEKKIGAKTYQKEEVFELNNLVFEAEIGAKMVKKHAKIKKNNKIRAENKKKLKRKT